MAWIRNLMDMAFEQFASHEPTRKKVNEAHRELEAGLQGVDLKTVQARINKTTALMEKLMSKSELSGPVYEDLIRLKSLYSRYQNYAQWLRDSS